METRHCGKQRPGVARPRPPGRPAHRWSRSGNRLADLLAGLHAVFAGICCAGTEKMVTYRPGGPPPAPQPCAIVHALASSDAGSSSTPSRTRASSSFRRVMETNYFGAVRCVKEVLPRMRKRGSGCIINVTSVAGRVAFSATSAHCASKFALEAFTESLAQEVKGYGIKVALVEPGIIDTAMATTNLPRYVANTIYPHGRRIHAFFTNPEKPEASPTLVGEMIRYVIESH